MLQISKLLPAVLVWVLEMYERIAKVLQTRISRDTLAIS